MVKEIVSIKNSFEKSKKVKLVRVSLIDLIVMKTQLTAILACHCVKRVNVVIGLRKEIFARTHTATHKLTSAQRLIVTTMTHTQI